ncbi:MAG: glycosyltransferase [Candidatus Dadabacteria bacterium]|nr:MAG: glycosyltransferase [Candidatus Dadabacteria bacterium]
MARVLMLVLNTFENDSRVYRTAKTLSDNGHQVLLVCRYKEGLPRKEEVGGFEVERVELPRITRKELKEIAKKRAELLIKQALSEGQKNPSKRFISICKVGLYKFSYYTWKAINGVLYLPIYLTLSLINLFFRCCGLAERCIGAFIRKSETAMLSVIKARWLIGYLAGSQNPIISFLRGIQPLKSLFWYLRRRSMHFLAMSLRKLKALYWPVRRVILLSIRKVKNCYWFLRRQLLRLRNAIRRVWIVRLRWFSQRLKGTFLSFLFPDYSFEKRKFSYEAFGDLALERAREFVPDIVHAHDFNTLIAAGKIYQEMAVPYIYDSHELWVHRNRPTIVAGDEEREWEARVEKELMIDAAASITVCDSIADFLAKEYGVKRPIVVRNTPDVPPSYLSAEGKTTHLRHRLGLAEDDFVMVYVGRIAANRGVEDILGAMKLLPPQVKFVALGAMAPHFEGVFRRYSLKLNKRTKRVFLHPPVPSDEVSEVLLGCDLSLVTMNQACLSYLFALPNKLFESIHAGLPIVGPDSPEIKRILERYNCGLVYKDRNSADLAKKIETIFKSSSLISELREGSRRAAQDLTWEKEKRVLLDLYSELLEDPSLAGDFARGTV